MTWWRDRYKRSEIHFCPSDKLNTEDRDIVCWIKTKRRSLRLTDNEKMVTCSFCRRILNSGNKSKKDTP